MRIRRKVVLAVLAAAGAVTAPGCRSAASVFLDLPESKPRADPAAPAFTTQARPIRERVRATPPIEQTDDPDSILALLPLDAAGGIDWSAAVRDGMIDPRRSLPGTEPDPDATFGFDFFFGEFETWFPHSSHATWTGCSSCHPAIYRTRGEPTTMGDIGAKESCGRCHGTVAFGPEVCERCHPQATMPAGRITPSLTNDIVFTRDTTTTAAQEMTSLPPSIFPHWRHRIEFACTACHPRPFEMRTGISEITMETIQMNRDCGSCHDGETAFGVMQCDRCHTEPPPPIRPAKPDVTRGPGEPAAG